MTSATSTRPHTHDGHDPGKEDGHFEGFPNLTANFIYCPNQFFDVCIPNASRGTVRLVAYLLKRTLGWLDANGTPIEQNIRVSFREIVSEAGIGRGAIRESIDEAIRGRFILCVEPGRVNANDHVGQAGCFALRWDAEGKYTKDVDSFEGFFASEGNRTPIPNAFFDRVIRCETLAVTKVVGTVLRHTVGYQNQFGRRLQAPLSYTYIQQYAHICDRSTLSQALQQALKTGYIRRVEEGYFDPRRDNRNPATYAVRWLEEAKIAVGGSKNPPVGPAQFKKPTSQYGSVQKRDQLQNTNPTSDGPRIRPAEPSKNPTTEKTVTKTSFKQQQHAEPTAVAVGQSEGYRLLRATGFDDKLAVALSRLASPSEIELQIAWLPRRNPKRNPRGMLRRAIEERWSEPTTLAAASDNQSQSRAIQNAEVHTELDLAQQEKERLRAERLAAWRALSADQKTAYYGQAIERADSSFTRSRLRRHRDLDNPPTEVLALLAGDRGVRATIESLSKM